ncbi:hypothetical protein PVA45_01220 [Entomospira entomophila]|uniref:Uncharacterized protein n=1 Tax=Entomospira entomophila TaxID=2719988 RepID=A0A968KQU3_9SPIO|nr:hypothetical protein [Entomospira entomophilus]NIZ40139.1 hypothetical protein [Entomospira entomophilus]WDI35697.1 hypothetical protein PVA45_01220 [Entomospira entomophilus]
MQKNIHYEDNLFFIISQIEQLTRLADLQLDGNFLCDKYMLDINFFHRTLIKFEDSIIQNRKLIYFQPYLQLIRRARSALEILLEKMKESNKELAKQLQDKLDDELNELINEQRTRIDILLNKLQQQEEDSSYNENETIGIEELELLLQDDFDEKNQDR